MAFAWTDGDVSGSDTLTAQDHLYETHINELRQAADTLDADGDALAAAAVLKTGTQTIAGVKTFSSIPIVPALSFQNLRTAVTVGPLFADFSVANYASADLCLQAAINAMSDAGGGYIYQLPGAYDWLDPVTMKSHVKWLGNGSATNNKLHAGSDCDMISTPAGGIENILIQDVGFDGDGTNQAGGSALLNIAGNDTLLKDIFLQRLIVKNSRCHGIMIHGSQDRYRKVIRNCYIENHGPVIVGFGIYADYAPNTIIGGNTIKTSNGNDAIEMGHSGEIYTLENYVHDGQIQFPFASNSIINGNILKTNVIQNDANNADDMIITGNQILGATPATFFAGITVFGARATIKNNNVKVTAQSGIRVYQGDGSRIGGNRIDGTNKDTGGSNGIYLEQTSNAHATDNYIKNFNTGVAATHDNNKIRNNETPSTNTGVAFSDSSSSGHVMTGNEVTDNDLSGATTPLQLNNQTSNYIAKNNKGLNPEGQYNVGNIAGGTITLNRKNGELQTATLTGNVTGLTLTAGVKNDLLILRLTQDGTGSRTITWPSNFKKAGGTLTLSTAAAAVDVITMRHDGTNWVEVSRALNLS